MRARLHHLILLTGLAVFTLSTYLSHLWPPNAPDWFYYGFIAKYYAEHGHYPRVSWWRQDQPPFRYQTPIIPLCAHLLHPHAGPQHDHRYLLALTLGLTATLLAWRLEPRMGAVIPWILTAVYNLHYAAFLGGKRTICLLTYPLLGTLALTTLHRPTHTRTHLPAAIALGLLTGACYDGWPEAPLILATLTLLPDPPRRARLQLLKLLAGFTLGALTTLPLPGTASHALLTYHRPGLVLKLLGNVAEWEPPIALESALPTWFYLVAVPIAGALLSQRPDWNKVRLAALLWTSTGLVVFRFGTASLLLLGPAWWESPGCVAVTLYTATLTQALHWREFWQRYPDWPHMKPVILHRLHRYHEPWGRGLSPPFEAWLYYEVDRVPPKVTPYDMDWRGWEPPLRQRHVPL